MRRACPTRRGSVETSDDACGLWNDGSAATRRTSASAGETTTNFCSSCVGHETRCSGAIGPVFGPRFKTPGVAVSATRWKAEPQSRPAGLTGRAPPILIQRPTRLIDPAGMRTPARAGQVAGARRRLEMFGVRRRRSRAAQIALFDCKGAGARMRHRLGMGSDEGMRKGSRLSDANAAGSNLLCPLLWTECSATREQTIDHHDHGLVRRFPIQ